MGLCKMCLMFVVAFGKRRVGGGVMVGGEVRLGSGGGLGVRSTVPLRFYQLIHDRPRRRRDGDAARTVQFALLVRFGVLLQQRCLALDRVARPAGRRGDVVADVDPPGLPRVELGEGGHDVAVGGWVASG